MSSCLANRTFAICCWNRIQIEVQDVAASVEKLKGNRFRSEIITGNGGKQILVEDPSGNPIELFEPFATR